MILPQRIYGGSPGVSGKRSSTPSPLSGSSFSLREKGRRTGLV
jgi:hypothetical protein